MKVSTRGKRRLGQAMGPRSSVDHVRGLQDRMDDRMPGVRASIADVNDRLRVVASRGYRRRPQAD
ncbi:hypothetical protein J4G37_21750 [Microvirga sp. 3-52]|nr:hypothetical protein [Microvirga sp. 3-52]